MKCIHARLRGFVAAIGLAVASQTTISSAATFTVTTTGDSGPGSLRAAILAANTNAGIDTIQFAIGTGVATIAPTSALPIITEGVIIDGTTQPGYVDSPIIEISGTNVLTGQGLHITGGNTTIRGLVINRFGRFNQNAIHMIGGGTNVVEGCYIGTDVTGTIPLGSNRAGVDISDSANNRIGGTTPQARNLISANNTGVSIDGDNAQFNVVMGNFIGTDVTGTNALGNRQSGVYLGSPNNQVGGTAPGAGNLISGNGTRGIRFENTAASNNVVQGNLIGTDRTGTNPLGNNANGIFLEKGASFNVIGGLTPEAFNVIAYNTTNGVYVFQGTNNSIYGNSIYFNTGLGIDLGRRLVTLNDVGDLDEGANNLQNFPVVTNVVTGGGTTTVQGTLHSRPNTTYLLQFYANQECDPSGHGEGEFFLGSTTVNTDGAGNAGFNVAFTNLAFSGEFVTATATDPYGNTSEFSECITVEESGFTLVCTLSPPVATNLVGTTHSVLATVTTNGSPAAGVDVYFQVVAGPHAGVSGADTTTAAGEAEFLYGGSTPGVDVIQATGTVSGVSFSAVALKTWLSLTNSAPVAICQDVTRIASSNLLAEVTAGDVDFGSHDPDGDPISFDLTPAGPYAEGTNTVSLVVADNRGGTNSCSARVIVLTTINLNVTKGSLRDGATAGKDKAKLGGTFAFNANSPDGTFNPTTDAVHIRLGTGSNPFLFSIGAGHPGWVQKGSKLSWRSPSGTLPKVKLQFDTVKRTFRFGFSGFNFPAAPSNPILVSFSGGNDVGASRKNWSSAKPGAFRTP